MYEVIECGGSEGAGWPNGEVGYYDVRKCFGFAWWFCDIVKGSLDISHCPTNDHLRPQFQFNSKNYSERKLNS